MVNMCLFLIYELDESTSHPLEILDRYWVFYVEVILMTFATLIDFERDEKTVYPAKYRFVHMHWGLGCLVTINLYMT